MLRMTTTRGGGGERRGKFRMVLFVNMVMTHDVMKNIRVNLTKSKKEIKGNVLYVGSSQQGRMPSKTVIDYLLDLRDNVMVKKYKTTFNKYQNNWGGKYFFEEDYACRLWGKHGKKTVDQKTKMIRVFFRWTCLYPENVTLRPELSHYLGTNTQILRGINKKN